MEKRTVGWEIPSDSNSETTCHTALGAWDLVTGVKTMDGLSLGHSLRIAWGLLCANHMC